MPARRGSRLPAVLAALTLGLLIGALSLPAAWEGGAPAPDVAVAASSAWSPLAPLPDARQEVSTVALGGKLYVAGAGTQHRRYDPASGTWTDVAPLPAPLDHIQGVAVGGKLYYVGGIELHGWPDGSVGSVYVYDPATNAFTPGAPMPAGRERGAGGVAVHDGRILYAGGLHEGEAVAWVDAYSPATNSWSPLPDMPRTREHFQAAVVGDRLYAAGGRRVDMAPLIAETDALDLTTGTWATGLAPMPTPRSGYGAVVVGDEIVTVGGEGWTGEDRTFPEVEAYRPATDTWRTLPALPRGRHGIQAAVLGGTVHVVGGGLTLGGGNATAEHLTLDVTDPGPAPGPGGPVDPSVPPATTTPATTHSPATTAPHPAVKTTHTQTTTTASVGKGASRQAITADRAVRLRTLRDRGLAVRCQGPSGARCRLELRATRRQLRALGLRATGRGSEVRLAATTVRAGRTARLRPTATVRQRLRGPLKLTVRGVLEQGDGERTVVRLTVSVR